MQTTIEQAVRHLKNGGLVVMMDDDNRENEGDLIGLGSKMTPENVNFMVTKARGLLCAPISNSLAKSLELTQMVSDNTEANGTKFTYSVDGSNESTGVTTGVSAYDRSSTIFKLASDDVTKNDFVHPGHTFPLVADQGGVLARRGHTEAAIDLAILAGEPEVGAICEILLPDGHMARKEYLEQFAIEHELPMITVEQLVEYLQSHERKDLTNQDVVCE